MKMVSHHFPRAHCTVTEDSGKELLVQFAKAAPFDHLGD